MGISITAEPAADRIPYPEAEKLIALRQVKLLVQRHRQVRIAAKHILLENHRYLLDIVLYGTSITIKRNGSDAEDDLMFSIHVSYRKRIDRHRITDRERHGSILWRRRRRRTQGFSQSATEGSEEGSTFARKVMG
jgi:hypothetical protein